MEKIDKLKEWIKEIVPYTMQKEDYIVENKAETRSMSDDKNYEIEYKAVFYTNKSKYYIYAAESGDGHDYLGAGSSLRKPYPGEDWTRGHDLPDGPLDRKTWESIKNAIIKDEMVILSKYTRNPPDHTAEATVVGPSLGDEKNENKDSKK